eukprot:NODE_7012_length_800_cov_69.666174_g6774_i0.p1 GENE.NODE_7012_length_800_cov_69.666174_g6774_i0~~NODE_7012_length_800_cov_69.666174_g6774_i0.p1  ORF type:complete len:265 (-),score=58.40 NODE_7012_length_800_cov_69.666174_g6774_i0:5-739(-)
MSDDVVVVEGVHKKGRGHASVSMTPLSRETRGARSYKAPMITRRMREGKSPGVASTASKSSQEQDDDTAASLLGDAVEAAPATPALDPIALQAEIFRKKLMKVKEASDRKEKEAVHQQEDARVTEEKDAEKRRRERLAHEQKLLDDEADAKAEKRRRQIREQEKTEEEDMRRRRQALLLKRKLSAARREGKAAAAAEAQGAALPPPKQPETDNSTLMTGQRPPSGLSRTISLPVSTDSTARTLR